MIMYAVKLTQIFTPKRTNRFICSLTYPLLHKLVLKEKTSNIFNFPSSKGKPFVLPPDWPDGVLKADMS